MNSLNREAVARIIDPVAFEKILTQGDRRGGGFRARHEPLRRSALAKADQIIALEDGEVREGWVLVPREPTEEMLDVGIAQARDCTDEWRAASACIAEHVYRAMISAVPGLGGDQGEEGDMASNASLAATGPLPRIATEAEPSAALICQACNGRFATLRDGLCAICDMEDMEQMLEDRDRE